MINEYYYQYVFNTKRYFKRHTARYDNQAREHPYHTDKCRPKGPKRPLPANHSLLTHQELTPKSHVELLRITTPISNNILHRAYGGLDQQQYNNNNNNNVCVCVYVCLSICLSVCLYVCMYVFPPRLRRFTYKYKHHNSSTKVNVKEGRNVRVKETQSNIIYNL